MEFFILFPLFCNAGFDIISLESLIPYVDNTLLNITLMFLIVLGGLGFMVWTDTIRVLKLKWTKKPKQMEIN